MSRLRAAAARACTRAGLRWPDLAGIAAYALIVLLPVLWLTGRYLAAVAGGDASGAADASLARTVPLLAHSLMHALAVAVAVCLVGTLAALRLWRWRAPLLRRLRWLPLAYLAVPGYVHALAWSRAGDAADAMLVHAAGVSLSIPPAVAAWWVHSVTLLPIGIGLALVGLRTIDHRVIDAARQAGTDLHALLRVILPLVSPHVVAAAALVFVLALSDYTVPSLFQSGVYALEIFAEFSAANDALSAFATALPLLGTAAVLLAAARPFIERTATARSHGDYDWRLPPAWPAWLRWAQGGALALVVLQLAVPTAALFADVGSIEAARASLSAAAGDLLYTLRLAVVAALLSLPLAAALARAMRRRGAWRLFAWAAVLLPLLFPPPLLGIAVVETWLRASPGAVYGSDLLPLFAYLARFTGVTTLVILAQQSRIDTELLDAARVTQPAFAVRLWKVYVPLIGPGLAAGWLLFVALSLGELATDLLTVPPGRSTLAMRIYGYLHYGASESVAALCLAIAAVTVLATAAALSAFGRRRPNAAAPRS